MRRVVICCARTLLLLSILIVSGCSARPSTLTPVAVTQAATLPIVVSATPTPKSTEGMSGPLFVDPDNSRYFTDGTLVNGKHKAVLLTGSHTWCNFMDCDDNASIPATFNYTAYLDFLQSKNHNFFRLWRAENARGGEAGDNFWFDPLPYQRSTTCCAFDGKNKFDLTQFNQAYFDRMRQRVIQAGDRGMYVSIMLFDGWSVESKEGGHEPWKGHPYKLSNNINNINGDTNNDSQGGETHTLANAQVTALQEAYVHKVIDTVNDLNNVLYEISNESTGSVAVTAWEYHMINYIKGYEATQPKQHPVGMTWQWPNGSNADLFASPADWIAPGENSGNALLVNPLVADGSKVIVGDTDHLCGICGDRQWVWKSFTRGQNPIFMDIYDNATSGRGAPFTNANEVEIRNNLGYVRSYATRINLVAMVPHGELCSSGYCLANPVANGPEYLVYRPTTSGNITVNLSAVSSAKQLKVEWFNPSTGATTSGGSVYGGGSSSFAPPFSSDAVLYIYDASFVDVPLSHPYYSDIQILFANGYTAGCSVAPLMFCPDVIMDRAQSAVFMMRGNFGGGYLPPSPPSHFFTDNWANATWAETWAEAMFTNNLTAGCSLSPLMFCPYDQLTNEQLAVFGLRLKYGLSYQPPSATGTVFADLPDVNFWATPWAEQAYVDGLIPSCGMSGGKPLFCPTSLVSRGFGAYVIVKAKNLTMP